jgi:hypothetical protein
MSGREDERLEREVRGLLAARDPGPAPDGLRDRVDRVAETARAGATIRRRLARVVVPVLGLAAGVALLLLAAPLLAPPRTGPGAPTTPASTFDPMLQGLGLVPPPALEAEALVVLGLLAVGGLILALAPSGPRRTFVTLMAVVVLGFGGAQVLLTHAASGPAASSGGIGVLNVEQTESVNPYPVYITAAPGGPFSFGFSVVNAGPLPIRLDGVVADPQVQAGRVEQPTLRAVWRGGGANGDVIGPTEPFAPTELASGEFVFLWLVGTASPCAAGPSFDPAAGQVAMVGMPELRVQYSVLGLPRTTAIRLPFDPLQPYRAGCPASP